MSISPFFLELRSVYQAEMDDLSFDSEGRDVLRQRLVAKRSELAFLLQMIELSPEMVAVIFHQGFQFKAPAVMDHVLSQDADELPEWDSLNDAVALTAWAQELADVILTEPAGQTFMTIAAALSYMHDKPDGTRKAASADDEDAEDKEGEGHGEHEGDDARDPVDGDDDEDARARDEAGANWLADQGFDRKD